MGYKDDEMVEYDLDNEDEDWLEKFNGGGDHRLSDTRFERMLWKLELAWSENLEQHINASGMYLWLSARHAIGHMPCTLESCLGIIAVARIYLSSNAVDSTGTTSGTEVCKRVSTS